MALNVIRPVVLGTGFASYEVALSSSITGTWPLGFNARYSGLSTTPNAPPASTRLYGNASSSTHHNALRTFDEFLRPHTFSMIWLLIDRRRRSLRRDDELRLQREVTIPTTLIESCD